MTLSQREVTGAEVYAVTIADQLINNGHNVIIVSDTLTKQTNAHYIPMRLSDRSFLSRIKNVKKLSRLIRENNIHIVHAHSRASAWVSSFACKISKIPLVTTVHGRQSTFLSRKIIKGFGYYTIAVCEEIKKQVVNHLGVSEHKIEVLRNGFDISSDESRKPKMGKRTITYITRLSGPKGELAFQVLENIKNNRDRFGDVHIRVIGGQEIPERFKCFTDDFEFTGYFNNIKEHICCSDVVIGSGRIAIESILCGRPTIAAGEATIIGLIEPENLRFALETNFGDMAEYEKVFDFEKLLKDIEKGLKHKECHSIVRETVKKEFDITRIVQRIDYIYQSVLVRYHKYEIPVLMYHRVIKSKDEKGKHGIYVTADQFEKHMKYLSDHGYRTLDFSEAMKVNRFDGKKYVIITFDDGYEDNYLYAFPIMKKYGFKAVIFLVTGVDYNKWDHDLSGEPRLRFMDKKDLMEMQKNGIIFGAHTMTHPDLTALDEKKLECEITEPLRILTERLNNEVTAFAYPYGRLNQTIKETVRRAGYSYGIATDSGPLGLHEDKFQIRRIGIFPNTNTMGFARKVRGNYLFRKIKDKSVVQKIPQY
ncbi:MAG: polysaccharide deacetylase family protein [Bacillota bacterium]